MEWVTTSTLLRDLREPGGDAAWERFVERFRAPVAAFARRYGMTPTDAEDVAQETLLAFAETLRSGQYDRERGRLSTWLFGIAYRQVLRERRRQARGARAVAAGTDATDFWSALPDEREAAVEWDRQWEQAVLQRCLEQARRQLHPETYRAFELVVVGQCPPAEAAEALGMSVSAVYNAKHRVLKRIRELTADIEGLDQDSGENPARSGGER